MKIFYMGLEPYEARYTLQLTDWCKEQFNREDVEFVEVKGEKLTSSKDIITGQVLDAHGRGYWSLTQIASLIKLHKEKKISSEDVIYFEDMFSPGIEALPYIFNQVDKEYRPQIWVRCLAQTIDPDDFTCKVTGMRDWMRKYEEMCDNFVDGILASNEEMVMHLKICGFKCPIYNISGLAFCKKQVQEMAGMIPSWRNKPKIITWASRLDEEKNVNFFLDIVEENKDLQFQILQGGPLRSNNIQILDRLQKKYPNLAIHTNLSKKDYYQYLKNSRVLFNCALQDWTSNTISEADALGCNVVVPNYRSFPEICNNDERKMFVCWSKRDAVAKLKEALKKPINVGAISDWTNLTNQRILHTIVDKSLSWYRGWNYRDNLVECKYKEERR